MQSPEEITTHNKNNSLVSFQSLYQSASTNPSQRKLTLYTRVVIKHKSNECCPLVHSPLAHIVSPLHCSCRMTSFRKCGQPGGGLLGQIQGVFRTWGVVYSSKA